MCVCVTVCSICDRPPHASSTQPQLRHNYVKANNLEHVSISKGMGWVRGLRMRVGDRWATRFSSGCRMATPAKAAAHTVHAYAHNTRIRTQHQHTVHAQNTRTQHQHTTHAHSTRTRTCTRTRIRMQHTHTQHTHTATSTCTRTQTHAAQTHT